MVKTYSKGDNTNLSANFKAREFDCKGGDCNTTLIDTNLVNYLQKIRDHFDMPVNITSGYRCATHNSRVGGASQSYHKKGMAADIYINGVAPLEIAKYAESLGILGIGLYDSFVHVDTRTSKSFWYGSQQAYRSTFGGKYIVNNNNNNTSNNTSNGKEESKMKDFGIDISRWQGNYNLAQAKNEGVKFVIVKGGGGDDGLYKDSQFENNYNKAKALGLPVGAYWFSKARTVAEAEREAEYFYNNCLKGKKFELPVYMDVEHKEMLNLGKNNLTAVIKAFCSYLENKNMWVGIYSSLSYFSTYMNDDDLQRYAHWVACWANSCNYKYPNSFGMWQFGGETNTQRSNKVAGQTTDQDYMLFDYPKNIKERGKNGYGIVVEESNNSNNNNNNNNNTPVVPDNTKQKALIKEIKSKIEELEKML